MGWLAALTLEDPGHRFTRISDLLERVNLHEASLESYPSIFSAFSKHPFDEGLPFGGAVASGQEFRRRLFDDEDEH